MNKDTLKKQIPASYQDLVEVMGIEMFLKVCKLFGGTNLYFPKEQSIVRPIRNEKILNEFTGDNYKALAQKYNLCETRVREIISKASHCVKSGQ